eukprot:TRINITY_DN5152_c0_g1_i1.p1 TRINITY_DN5152_c0_g1~~TRINITY_DN5152_c0_g1_i1.p1  ORF type:complete len:2262 (+),score=526.63 TRINITY_DN5152_c0_g1_i1:103-6888(+)
MSQRPEVSVVLFTGSRNCFLRRRIISNEIEKELKKEGIIPVVDLVINDSEDLERLLEEKLKEINEKYQGGDRVMLILSFSLAFNHPVVGKRVNKVLFFSNSEETAFHNGIEQNSFVSRLPTDWSDVCNRLIDLGDDSKNFIFLDADKDPNDVERVCFKILKGERFEDSDVLLTWEEAQGRHSVPYKFRPPQYVATVSKGRQSSNTWTLTLTEVHRDLTNPESTLLVRFEVIDQLHSDYSSHKSAAEERSFNRSLMSYAQGDLLGILLKESFLILDHLRSLNSSPADLSKLFDTEEDWNLSCLTTRILTEKDYIVVLCEILGILEKISCHIHFRHQIFKMKEFYQLIVELWHPNISKPYPRLTFYASRFTAKLMKTDSSTYGTKFEVMEKRFSIRISELVAQTVIYFVGYTFKESPTSKEHAVWGKYWNHLLDVLDLNCLKYLLKGSTEHCAGLELTTIDDMVQVASNANRWRHYILTVHFGEYLGQILKYGSKQLAQAIFKRRKQLVDITHKCISGFIQNENISSNYFSSIVESSFLIFNEIKCMKGEEEGKEEAVRQEEFKIEEHHKQEFRLKLLESMEETRQWKKTCKVDQTEVQRKKIFDVEMLKQEVERLSLQFSHQKEKKDDETNQIKGEKQILMEESLRQLEEIKKLKNELDYLRSNQKEISIDRVVNVAKFTAITTVASINENTVDESTKILMEIRDPRLVTKEEAKKFIFQLKSEREHLTLMRRSICGSLKHLGSDLYSSPLHFLHELVQNADDNRYAPGSQPHLVIRTSPTMISVYNNEVGFLPKDVNSLCSLGDSTKEGGIHIGQKGLGFKSVFACTDYPSVQSGVWNFGFRPGKDEMSFITPHWNDEEKESREGTLITLPLKKNVIQSDFIDQLKSMVDYSLLFAVRHLREIRLISENAEGKKEELTIIKEVDTITDDPEESSFSKFTSFSFSNYISKKVSFKNKENRTSEQFLVYEVQVKVPDEERRRETSRSHCEFTRIMLAFEVDRKRDSQKTFTIFSFLPVQDIGLKFVVNCDWVLVTNRESVRENSWNSFIRDACADFFLWIFSNETDLTRLLTFLPNTTPEMTSWWRKFVDRMRNGVENKILPSLLGSSTARILRNRRMEELIPFEESKRILNGIELYDPSSKEEEEMLLTHFGHFLPLFSIGHVLDFMNDPSFTLFQTYLKEKDDAWWSKFFKLLTESAICDSSLLEKAKESPVFLIKRGEKRNTISKSSKVIRRTDGKLIEENWREDVITLLHSESEYEISLLELLGFSLIDSEEFIGILIPIHLENPTNPGTIEQVWKDLKFIRDHFDHFSLKSQSITGTKEKHISVSIPVERGFVLSEKATMPSVLSVLMRKNSDRVVGFPDCKELDEILRWEYFLLRLGVQIPQDYDRSLYSFQNTLPPFTSFNPKSVHYSSKIARILDNRGGKSISLLRSLPVFDCNRFSLKEEEKSRVVAISDCSDRSLVFEKSSWVAIPNDCRGLASLLGVTLEADFELCIKALQNLVNSECKDVGTYCQWLAQLRFKVDSGERSQDVDVPLLYLPESHKGRGKFYHPRDIVICEQREETGNCVRVASEGKGVVSVDYNQEYFHFSDVLIALGASKTFKIETILETLQKESKDRSHFIPLGLEGRLLSDVGLDTFKILYQYLDCALEKEMFNELGEKAESFKQSLQHSSLWERIALLNEQVPELRRICIARNCESSIDEFPVVKQDKSLVTLESLKNFTFLACLEPYLVDAIVSEDVHCHFFEPSFALSFPHLIASLRLEYLELRSLLQVQRGKPNNIECHLHELSEAFSNTIATTKRFDVLSTKYLICNLYYSKERILRNNNYKSDKDLMLNNAKNFCLREGLKFVIRKNHYAVGCSVFLEDYQQKAALFANALCKILQDSGHSTERAEKLAMGAVNGKPVTSKVEWEFATDEILSVNTDEFLFAPYKLSLGECYYGIGEPEQLSSSVETSDNNFSLGLDKICFDYEGQHSAFTCRINSLSNEEKRPSREFEYSDRVFRQDDPKKMRDVGFKAEHFVFLWLQNQFGNSFSATTGWVSGLRLELFPGKRSHINDGAGYDFTVKDTLLLFGDEVNRTTLIEVKGFAGEWTGEFSISSNEVERKEKSRSNQKDEVYVIIVVENVVDSTKINIAEIICWSDNPDLVEIRPDSYIGRRTNPSKKAVIAKYFPRRDTVTSSSLNQNSHTSFKNDLNKKKPVSHYSSHNRSSNNNNDISFRNSYNRSYQNNWNSGNNRHPKSNNRRDSDSNQDWRSDDKKRF